MLWALGLGFYSTFVWSIAVLSGIFSAVLCLDFTGSITKIVSERLENCSSKGDDGRNWIFGLGLFLDLLRRLWVDDFGHEGTNFCALGVFFWASPNAVFQAAPAVWFRYCKCSESSARSSVCCRSASGSLLTLKTGEKCLMVSSPNSLGSLKSPENRGRIASFGLL